MKNVTRWGYAVLLAMTSAACAEQQAPKMAGSPNEWVAGYIGSDGKLEAEDMCPTREECEAKLAHVAADYEAVGKRVPVLALGSPDGVVTRFRQDAQVVTYMGDDTSNETVVVAVCDELTCNRMAEALNTVQPGTYYVETR